MARSTGYALLAALTALVAIVSTAIFIGVGHSTLTAHVEPRASAPASAVPARVGTWVGTWSTAATAGEPNTAGGYPGTSIRNVVHSSIGGTSARVELSNSFGTQPLVISHATIAVSAGGTGDGPAAEQGTMRALTFGGNRTVTIPAGRSTFSDAARLAVPSDTDLLVTTYSPTASGPVTYHQHPREVSYAAYGEHTAQVSGEDFTGKSQFWRYVTAVDVFTKQAVGSIVALGDSITDGFPSTVGANRRWPDRLAARLLASDDMALHMGVLNAGIGGNQVLVDGGEQRNLSALKRLDRDVLARTGVRVVVVDLGINDILRSDGRTDATAITDGLREIVRRAHDRGLRVLGATLGPVEGRGNYNATTEGIRQQVNATIRAGGLFDAVVDFDKALRDPSRPTRLLPAYDSGDHIHPNDAGFQAMADSVTLSALKTSTETTT